MTTRVCSFCEELYRIDVGTLYLDARLLHKQERVTYKDIWNWEQQEGGALCLRCWWLAHTLSMQWLTLK